MAHTVFKSDRALKRQFNFYNKKYFSGKLPDVYVWWEPINAAFGDILFMESEQMWRIRIHPFTGGWRGVWKFTLLHEMCHLSLQPYTGHGRKFDREMIRLAELGAFNKLW